MIGYRPWLTGLLAWLWIASPAQADCFGSEDLQILALQTLVSVDATQALEQSRRQIEALTAAPRGGGGAASRMASLYAVQAQAYSILELEGEARKAAAQGLKFATGGNDPVHLDLLSAYAENVYDEAAIKAALGTINAARSAQPRGSLADTCLLITQGLLEYRQDRTDLAIVSLTQAYHASAAPARAEPHMLAASLLSVVMRSMGDYPQALALNQEVIDWDTARRATLELSVSRFLRGQIFKLMGRYGAAIVEFTQARTLSAQLGDRQGIAFADMRICESHVDLKNFAAARQECDNASGLFAAARSMDSVKETQALSARISFAQGHAAQALALLNAVLDRNGADLPPRQVPALYEARARINAALHRYHAAFEDLSEYAQRYAAANDADRTRQAGALRARFETDRQIERNTALQSELAASQVRSLRQSRQLRWNAVVSFSGVLVIALLIYFLLANLRFRKKLQKFASQDALTGLANRRRTAELALAALQAASDTQRPLTLAIIDMDHFKIINDCCGHATGDYVLKEFAKVGRTSLRATDILGRWGGEEFLLVMPEATEEQALASLERLRALVLGIPLPASGAGLRVTLSAGLAVYEGKSLDELIARADAALYVAKNDGRDRVRVAEPNQQTAATGIRRALRL